MADAKKASNGTPHGSVPVPAGAAKAVREAMMKMNENILALAGEVATLRRRLVALERKEA